MRERLSRRALASSQRTSVLLAAEGGVVFVDIGVKAPPLETPPMVPAGVLTSRPLSSMRATFAPGGGGGLQSDPALEPSEVGGHTLFQRRLALFGKVLVAQSI